MLHNKFALPPDLTPESSRLLRYYCLLLVVLAVFAIWLTALPWYLQIGIMLLLLVTVIMQWRDTSRQIRRLRVDQKGRWQIQVQGQWHSAELSGECIVTSRFVWLNFSCCNRFGRKQDYRLLLLPDSVPAAQLRHLRLWLRFMQSEAENPVESVPY